MKLRTGLLVLFALLFSALVALSAETSSADDAASGDPRDPELEAAGALPLDSYVPLFDGENDSETVVFLVDSTASMAAPFGDSTRLERVQREILSVTSALSDNVEVGAVYFSTAPRCKHSDTAISEMGSKTYLARYLWWAYKGDFDNGALQLDGVAHVMAGPYVRVLPPTTLDPEHEKELVDFLESQKPEGLSSMASGLLEVMKHAPFGTVLMAFDGPPQVLLDGRVWEFEEGSSNARDWKISPWFPQGDIPENGIDGYVKREVQDAACGAPTVFAAYFAAPEWTLRMLQNITGQKGEVFKIED